MTYAILAAPYTTQLCAKLGNAKHSSREWWNLRAELDNAEVYRHEWELVREFDGLATVKNQAGHQITLPAHCLAELPEAKPLATQPPYCLIPHPIGATVKVLFVRMTIADRQPVKRGENITWEYKCLPVVEHAWAWGDGTGFYPHAYLEVL